MSYIKMFVLKVACPQSRLSSMSPVLNVACPQCLVLNVAVLNVFCPQCPIGFFTDQLQQLNICIVSTDSLTWKYFHKYCKEGKRLQGGLIQCDLWWLMALPFPSFPHNLQIVVYICFSIYLYYCSIAGILVGSEWTPATTLLFTSHCTLAP